MIGRAISGSSPDEVYAARSETEDRLRFRLTYEGPLRAKQKDALSGQTDPRAPHTHEIREVFHGQLKRLWETNRFLSEARRWSKGAETPDPMTAAFAHVTPFDNELVPLKDFVAGRYMKDNYRFVPLVLGQWELECDLNILFLRRDIPGSVIHAGDIDNRIKNLIDALRVPAPNELRGNENPKEGQDPFFVLLEDDKHVTGFRVETDTLLDPCNGAETDQSYVKLVITVKIRPYSVTEFNLGFA